MSNFYKNKLKNIIEILVMLIGISCFVTQALQYFTDRWSLHFYKEVFMLVLFYIFSRYNSKVVELFDAIVFRVKNFKVNKTNEDSCHTDDELSKKEQILGDGIDTDEEV